jgi:hypothetical protein
MARLKKIQGEINRVFFKNFHENKRQNCNMNTQYIGTCGCVKIWVFGNDNNKTKLNLGFVGPCTFSHSNESTNQMHRLVTGLLFVV